MLQTQFKVYKEEAISEMIEHIKHTGSKHHSVSVYDRNEPYYKVGDNINTEIDNILKEDLHRDLSNNTFFFVFNRPTNRTYKIYGFLHIQKDYIVSLNGITGDLIFKYRDSVNLEKLFLYQALIRLIHNSPH